MHLTAQFKLPTTGSFFNYLPEENNQTPGKVKVHKKRAKN
jgi:hypothetical protein